jgi:hypothetical protein
MKATERVTPVIHIIVCPQVFAVGVQCIILAFWCEPRRMLSINQGFGKHYICHLQGECVVGRVLEA